MHIKFFNFSYYNIALSQTRSKLATLFGLNIQGIIAKFTKMTKFTRYGNKGVKKMAIFSFVNENEEK